MKQRSFLSTSSAPDRAYLRNFSAQASAGRGGASSGASQQQRSKSSKSSKRMKLFAVGMGIDMPFLVIVLVLLAIGMVMMFSASYPVALAETGNSYYYLFKQLKFAAFGLVLMAIASFANYHWFYRFAYPVLGLAVVLLGAVFFFPGRNGVHRWIGVGSADFQSSEFAKFAIIVFFAYWCTKYADKMKYMKYGLVPAIVVFVAFTLLLVFEPHYSGIVIMFCLILFMLWLGGLPVAYFIAIIGLAVAAVLIAKVTGLLGYAMERMDGWGQALIYTTDEMWDATWQTRNSLYAIGSGGLTGLGLGNSRQKYLYLPEPQNDFVFAIVCEELGFVWAALILCLFGLLVWRGIYISQRSGDTFGKLLGCGLSAQIGLQVILNILVITDWLPNTGISLPFFSSGGSSLVMLLAQMGVVLSVSRTSRIEKV